MLKRVLVIAVAAFTLHSCSESTVQSNTPMGIGDVDDPQARLAWEHARLRDPATGEIPEHIRKKELAFAKTLPKKEGTKSLNWDWRGPKNRGGRTRALAFDVRNTDIILAGGVTGGMWRSTDGGLSWIKTTALNDLQSVSTIVQDTRPGKEDTWYYGTGENYGVVSGTSFTALLAGDGIFKSTDNGQSWTQLPSTVFDSPQFYNTNGSFKQVNKIVIDPTNTTSDVVLAAIFNGIKRSTDGGVTWNTVLGIDTTNNQSSEQSEIVVSSSGVFYATIGDGAADEGFYRSNDGINWTKISNTPGALFPGNADRTVLAIDPQNEDKVWFLAQTSSTSTGVNGHVLGFYRYITGDGTGLNGFWESRTGGLPTDACLGYFTFNFGRMNTQSGYDMALAVHPLDSNMIYIGGINVWRSSNGFASADSTDWIGGYKCTPNNPKDYVYDNHHPDIHGIHFQPGNPSILWTNSDGGVHRTLAPLADSVIWQDRNNGYATSQFYTVHLEEGDASDDRVIGGTQDNGTYLAGSTNPNDDWTWIHRDDGAYAGLPTGADYVLASSQSGRLYKKQLDANNNEIGFERIDPTSGGNSYNFINQFVLDPLDNNQLYWVSASRIFRCNDLQNIPITNNWYNTTMANWSILQAASLPGSQRISTLDISHNLRSLFYGTTSGRLYRLDDLDGQMSRTDITDNNWPIGYMSCVAPNDINPDEWIITFSNYNIQSVWHTADGGANWTDISGNLEENPNGTGNGPAVFWATIYPESQNGTPIYFVGTSIGLFSTELLDGGNTVWAQEGANTLGNVPINMIATRSGDGTIAVATHGNGIYASSLPITSIGIEELDQLEQPAPFPNPASTFVQIPFTLSEKDNVQLQVFDMQGSVVRTVQNIASSTGEHTYVWNLRNDNGARVANGNYMLSITTGSKRISTQRIFVSK